jgi:hypothetical protein
MRHLEQEGRLRQRLSRAAAQAACYLVDQMGQEGRQSPERHRLRFASRFLGSVEVSVEDRSNRRGKDETSFRGLVPIHGQMPGLEEKPSSQSHGVTCEARPLAFGHGCLRGGA